MVKEEGFLRVIKGKHAGPPPLVFPSIFKPVHMCFLMLQNCLFPLL